MANLSPYIIGCKDCRLCAGAAYQLPPFLYAGSPTPHVLVIAQNPGEISDDGLSKWRFDLGNLITDVTTAEAIKTIYDVDFATSYGYHQMEKIFGENWLSNGKFMYTNAVRCRTPKNEAPSEEMELNCMGWTSQLPMPSVVVLMGKVAMRQFCNMVTKPELPAWKRVKFTYQKNLVHVMTIPHYAAMRSKDDIEKAKSLFEETLEEASISI